MPAFDTQNTSKYDAAGGEVFEGGIELMGGVDKQT